MNFIKEIVTTKQIFDTDEIFVGDKILVKRILSCKMNPIDGTTTVVYDINKKAVVLDIYDDETTLEVQLLSAPYDHIQIDVDDVVSGEYELSIVEEDK